MSRFLASTALSLALCLSTGALAQTATGGATPSGAVTQQQSGEYLADDVIGATVRNAQNENIGSVTDLVIDRNGQIKSAILSVGGFLGIGDKHVAVPWNQVQLTAADRAGGTGTGATGTGGTGTGATGTGGTGTGGTASGAAETSGNPAVMVNMTRDQLKQAPEFKTMAQQRRETDRTRTTPDTTAPGTRTPSQ